MPTDKQFILDLKIMLNDDRILNFEVQVVDEKDWPERSLTYACRTFDQLQKGETYLDIKPVYHIGFLDYDIKEYTPEFYATYKLLNTKNYELYSDKLVLSVVNLNQIDKATEEDRKYGIDHWARLFKADTWEAIKQMARENEYISDAAEAALARREATIAEKEAALARKEATIAEMDTTIAEKDKALQAQAAEISRLKALLESK